MNTNFKNAPIDGTMLEVVSLQAYAKNQDIYTPGSTAIEASKDGKRYVLPVRSSTDKRPGAYPIGNCACIYKYPEPDNTEYDYDDKVIDFSKPKDMKELIETQQQIHDAEYNILCNPDNIFAPKIDPLDGPEMQALKLATEAKHIDIDDYQYRFGPNFPNDKRQYKKHHATLTMINRIANNLDMEVRLVIKDKSPDVPNPMNTVIDVSLTGLDEGEENE